MKKRVVIRKYAFILSVLMILSVFMLSSCGKVKEYKTAHDSGKITINSYEDLEKLMFAKGTLPEDIAKVIPDFCIYDSANSEPSPIFKDTECYRANATINLDVLCNSCGVENIGDQPIDLFFNADKEIEGWGIDYDYKEAQIFSKILSARYQTGLDANGIDIYFPFDDHEIGALLYSKTMLVWKPL